MTITLGIAIGLIALGLGALIGWLVGARQGAALAAERDALKADRDGHLANFKQAAVDLEAMDREREAGALKLATLTAERDAQIAALAQARDALAAQFQEVGAKLLDRAQAQFLETAGARFQASEAASKAGIAQLLAPVSERLQRYENAVEKVENERRDAFGQLNGLMESLRVSNESVKAEAARLGNSLRNAPKARGRWGEQQLRNVLESCGLSEYADFQMEVSVDDGGGGRLRPDCVLRIPGDQILVIDAKVSLNAYQDAFNASDEPTRVLGLAAHAAAVKAHVNSLGNKAYWAQFATAPDYVILFIPGEHFLSAALENDAGLWDFAFEKRVLLATPTNLIAIARTVAAVWRQERVVAQAKEIAKLGKDLYASIATMNEHAATLGERLNKAVGAYNSFATSLETRVVGRARRMAELDVDTGGKSLDAAPQLDAVPRRLMNVGLPESTELTGGS